MPLYIAQDIDYLIKVITLPEYSWFESSEVRFHLEISKL